LTRCNIFKYLQTSEQERANRGRPTSTIDKQASNHRLLSIKIKLHQEQETQRQEQSCSKGTATLGWVRSSPRIHIHIRIRASSNKVKREDPKSKGNPNQAMEVMFTAAAVFVLTTATSPLVVQVSSFVSNPVFHGERHYFANNHQRNNNNNRNNHHHHVLLSAESTSSSSSSSSSSWSLNENWDSLSGESSGGGGESASAASTTPTQSLSKEEINDPIGRAVRQLEEDERQWIAHHGGVDGGAIPLKDEVDNAVEEIHSFAFRGDPSDPPLYDTEETLKQQNVSSEKLATSAEQEITMLVRCNQAPDRLLAGEGRALTPLTEAERRDVSQLMDAVACACDPASSGATATQQLGMTPFYVDAVANMFFEHAVAVPVTKDDKKSSEELVVMNRDGVANWITKSLGSEGKVSKHDKRVLAGE
jgi:hypothetical protein